MTTDEQDALIGRVIRESKEAEAELDRLLIKAEQIAAEIGKLSSAINARVKRAREAGGAMRVEGLRGIGIPDTLPLNDHGFEIGFLKGFEKALDLAAIDQLDREIGIAVAKAMKLRQQRRQLEV